MLGVAPVWLVFVLQYTGRASWLTIPFRALLFAVPLATLDLIATNEDHGLILLHPLIPRDAGGLRARLRRHKPCPRPQAKGRRPGRRELPPANATQGDGCEAAQGHYFAEGLSHRAAFLVADLYY
jgi:hypothetical protein